MPEREFFNLAEQQLNPPGKFWGNLGYWPAHSVAATADEYANACRALASQLAELAQLNANTIVLDVGFGCGDQLLLWLQHYRVSQLYGMNYSTSQTELAQQRLSRVGYSEQAQQCGYGDIAQLTAAGWHGYQQKHINRVLALDCIYHFSQRQQFLQQARGCLSQSGQLVYSDLFLFQPLHQLPRWQAGLIRLMLWLSRIPLANILTLQQQQQSLNQAGFVDVYHRDISTQVMLGFGRWLSGYKVKNRQATDGKTKNNNATNKKATWLKYDITAAFLSWAYRRGILGYALFRAAA